MRTIMTTLLAILCLNTSSTVFAQPPGANASPPRASAPRPESAPIGSLYSPTTRPGQRPVAVGFDGLRTPIDRRDYNRPRAPFLPPAGMYSPPSSSRPLSAGSSLTHSTVGKVTTDNLPGAPNRYQVYTYQNQNGGQTSVIYDRYNGTSSSVDQSVSYGQVYYGPKPAGTGLTPLPVGVSYGTGMGSNSGNVMGPSFGNAGPFGTGGSVGIPPTATTPSFVNPTYGVTQP